jgi:threonine/homoserine/homoserine lactone efflux protein
MPSWELFVSFLVATSVFALMPGPAMIYVAAQTMARGRRAGWLATLGESVGGLAHVVAAAAGLSALFAHVPAAYSALKLCGALYLVWLGIGLIRARLDGAEASSGEAKGPRRAFLDSMLVEILNPKTAIFFLAFLPQFVEPGASLPIWAQFVILGLIVNLFFMAGDVIAVLGAAAIIGKLKASDAAARLVRRLGGGLLIGLGLKLAAERG